MAARRHGMAGGRLRLAVAVLLLLAAAAPAREKVRSSQSITPQTLDALARQYRDAGLPLPAADAPLMLVQSGVIGTPGRHNLTTYVLGFKIPVGPDGNGADRFLMGTQSGDPIQPEPRFPPMRPVDAARGLPAAVTFDEHWQDSSGIFPVNNWLALAVQCHLRGYDRLAEQIFARGLATDVSVTQRLTPVGDGTPRDSLAATAWNHWMNVLCTEGSDRREILAHLEKLSAGFPAFDGPFQRDYLASLRLAMVPGKGAPDSVEGLVDALVDHTGYGNGGDDNDPGFARLESLGFEAVPALIAHLDDRRLTRSLSARADEVRYHPRRVGEVVGDLIEAIAGPEEFAADSSGQPGEPSIDKAAAERWWAKVSTMGEEAYMTAHVFPPSNVSLQIAAERYPQRLGEMYARILKEKPEVDCQAILLTIVSCGHLAREERRRLLQEGAASADVKCSFEAVGAMYEFDRADADAALIEKLDHWPADIATPYGSGPPESYIGRFMMSTDSAEVWQAFERALFRASTAFRMEMLKWLSGNGLRGGSQDVRLLALLDLFLDDEEVRVIRKEDEASGGKFEGYPLTADDRRISVRNFDTELLGALLTVKPPPGNPHDDRWWAKYRATVRTAIDQHARETAEAPAPDES